jgi:hypothetical protein
MRIHPAAWLLLTLVIISGFITLAGAFWDHNGLFEAGADALKVTIGGAVGAIAGTMSRE